MDSRLFLSIFVSLAALLLSSAAAQSPAPSDSSLKTLSWGTKLTAAQTQALEQALRANPEDLAARVKLMMHYFFNPGREARLRHVFWQIEHHPESAIFGFNCTSISPSPGALNDEADYARAKDLWLEQTERHPKNPVVWDNALRFFSQPGSDAATRERLLKRAQELGLMAPPPAHAPTRIRVGGGMASALQPCKLLDKVDPVYPQLARQARIQGTVRFTATIGKDGHVKNLQLVSGHPLLAPAAQEAVRQWVYQPARINVLNGEPVEVTIQIDVPFTLPESK